MIRAVIDTNVFISSFFGGNPRKIIERWENGRLIWCMTSKIIEEYVRVLQRLGLRDDQELKELLQLFAEGRHILFAAKTPVLNVVEQDPNDNMFLECAIALKCKIIISGDSHLTSIGNYAGIEILPPKDFLDRHS